MSTYGSLTDHYIEGGFGLGGPSDPRLPAYLRMVATERERQRDRVRSASAPARQQPAVPILRAQAPPAHSVWLWGGRRELRRSIESTDDGRGEAGGWLFGREVAGGIVIADADVERDNERSEFRVTLDLGKALASRLGQGRAVIGCWHTHPVGAGLPSDADIRGWAYARRELRAIVYLGLIVAPDRWHGYRLRAWMVGHDDVRPARIIEDQEVL